MKKILLASCLLGLTALYSCDDMDDKQLSVCNYETNDYTQVMDSLASLPYSVQTLGADAVTYGYGFKVEKDIKMCGIGFQSSLGNANTPYKITIENQANNAVLMELTQTFSDTTITYVNAPLVLRNKINYIIKRTNVSEDINSNTNSSWIVKNDSVTFPISKGNLILTGGLAPEIQSVPKIKLVFEEVVR